MKAIFLTGILSIATIASLSAQTNSVLADENARVSYAVGMLTGHQWKQQDIPFDPEVYARGIKDAEAGGATLLTQEEAQQALDAFRKEYTAKQMQKRAEQATKNKADGEAFLAANKNQPGVQILPVTAPDGKTFDLQYIVVTNGTGELPKATDMVTVNDRGTLIDGTEFDNSYKRGQPAQFRVGGVIPGWTYALLKMPAGSKWKLFIPSELAYGERGQPPVIQPNSVLIFDVELLSVQPMPAPAAMPVQPGQPLTSEIIKVPSADEMKKGAKIETIKPEDVEKIQAQSAK